MIRLLSEIFDLNSAGNTSIARRGSLHRYLYAGIGRFSNNSEQFCLELLNQHGIALTPGTDFGFNQSQQHIRFAYTTGLGRLQEAVSRLQRIFS